MRNTHLILPSLLLLALPLNACRTVPDAPPEIVVVEVPAPIRTCAPVSSLQRMVIPAETKIMYAITQIENPPYDPIERTEKQVRIVKPAQVLYVDTEGREVLDICENVEIGDIGPAEGAVIPAEDFDGVIPTEG